MDTKQKPTADERRFTRMGTSLERCLAWEADGREIRNSREMRKNEPRMDANRDTNKISGKADFAPSPPLAMSDKTRLYRPRKRGSAPRGALIRVNLRLSAVVFLFRVHPRFFCIFLRLFKIAGRDCFFPHEPA